jgi:hypothetical protein
MEGTPRQVKTQSFTIRASREQAQRWLRTAKHLKCASVRAWLEELADEQAERVCERLDGRDGVRY